MLDLVSLLQVFSVAPAVGMPAAVRAGGVSPDEVCRLYGMPSVVVGPPSWGAEEVARFRAAWEQKIRCAPKKTLTLYHGTPAARCPYCHTPAIAPVRCPSCGAPR